MLGGKNDGAMKLDEGGRDDSFLGRNSTTGEFACCQFWGRHLIDFQFLKPK